MKYHIGDILYLIKRDQFTRKRLKRIFALGCAVSLIIILFISAVGLYFIKPLLGFLFANIPLLNEFMFTHMRNVVLPYLQEDLLGMFSGLIYNSNVEEMKSIVNKYFEQLSMAKNISFEEFVNFTDNFKKIFSDAKITQSEVDSLRKYVTF